MFTLSVTVSSAAVGKVIGKAGSTIRALQERYKVQVPNLKSAPGSTADVVVTVKGENKDNVTAAIKEITDLAPLVKATVTIPRTAVGKVIGRAGATIRELQEATNCRINVPSGSGDAPVVVTVSGLSKGATDDAVMQITALVAAVKASDEVTIARSLVGKVIGRDGSTIRKIQDRYSVCLFIPKSGTDTVTITVSGASADSVASAIKKINTLVASLDV